MGNKGAVDRLDNESGSRTIATGTRRFVFFVLLSS